VDGSRFEVYYCELAKAHSHLFMHRTSLRQTVFLLERSRYRIGIWDWGWDCQIRAFPTRHSRNEMREDE